MLELAERIQALDWSALSANLLDDGYTALPTLLTPDECDALVAGFEGEHRFRKEVIMEKYSYGRGLYRYYDYPLPDLVSGLRHGFYPQLAPIANTWNERLRRETVYPDDLESYTQLCHAAGQTRPTPLLLQYKPGGYNCLHQDLYGELLFPMQVVFLLDRPGEDFDGGELVLVEQRPRKQSTVNVVPMQQGSGAIFAVNHRPGKGPRGYHRRVLRHGVSTLRSGQRHTLGIIFHDALK
jgi:hypothetical protein